MNLRRAALVTVAVLAATGCTASSEPTSGDDPTSTPTSPSSPAATPEADPSPPAPPRPRACYRLDFEEAGAPTSDARPVDCGGRHSAQTVFVGRLDTTVDGRDVGLDSAHVPKQPARVCPRRAAAFLGGTPEQRDLSRFEVVWFTPTPEESELGARWFRCDVIALAATDTLAVLPPPARLSGLLADDTAAASYGLCGTAEPGAPDFERVICARRHAWRAIGTIPLAGGRSYPGVREVGVAGDDACSDLARGQAEDPLRFDYGWEWPTAEQWRVGQRFGYCWAPD